MNKISSLSVFRFTGEILIVHLKFLTSVIYGLLVWMFHIHFCHGPFCEAEGPWSALSFPIGGSLPLGTLKNQNCDWSMQISLVIFVVLSLVRIRLLSICQQYTWAKQDVPLEPQNAVQVYTERITVTVQPQVYT